MKSKYLAGLIGFGLLSVAVVGCNTTINDTGSGGATSATGVTATGVTSVNSTGSKVTSATAGTGGAAGDGNDSFAQAVTIVAGTSAAPATATAGTIDVPGTDADFYKVAATAGPLLVSASSLNGVANDQTYVDMYVEVYDSNMQLIASNDDAYPSTAGNTDSEVITQIPTAGDYYIKVMDFCSSPLAQANQCTPDLLSALTNTDYQVFAAEVTADAGDVAEGAEPNNTQGTATLLTHAPTTTPSTGSYYLTTAWGTLSDATDVDWYKINIPGDQTLTNGGSPTTTISIPWGTTGGNGSGVEIGKVEVVDPLDAAHTSIATFDFTNEPRASGRTDISVPLTKGDAAYYFLKVYHGADVTPGNGKSYFIFQGVGEDNPSETQEVANSLPATPEVLSLLPMQTAYFIAGNLPTGDVDYFKMPATKAKMFVVCSAARSGSGLTGFTATVYKADGITPITGGSNVEDPTKQFTVPSDPTVSLDLAGETNPVVKINATGQAAGVSGTYYRCGFGFSDT